MKTRGRQPDDVTALLEVSCLLFKTQLTVKLAYFWAPPHTARPFIHFPHLYLNVFTCVRTHAYVHTWKCFHFAVVSFPFIFNSLALAMSDFRKGNHCKAWVAYCECKQNSLIRGASSPTYPYNTGKQTDGHSHHHINASTGAQTW